jgi:hypothetical protein
MEEAVKERPLTTGGGLTYEQNMAMFEKDRERYDRDREQAREHARIASE